MSEVLSLEASEEKQLFSQKHALGFLDSTSEPWDS